MLDISLETLIPRGLSELPLSVEGISSSAGRRSTDLMWIQKLPRQGKSQLQIRRPHSPTTDSRIHLASRRKRCFGSSIGNFSLPQRSCIYYPFGTAVMVRQASDSITGLWARQESTISSRERSHREIDYRLAHAYARNGRDSSTQLRLI